MAHGTRSRSTLTRSSKPLDEESNEPEASSSPGEASEAPPSQQRSASAPSTPEKVRDADPPSQSIGANQAMFSPPPYKSGRVHRDQGTSDTATPAAPTPTPMSATPMGLERTREFDQLDLNNMDFADNENDPLMLASFSAEDSPTRGPPPMASPRDSASEHKRPSSAVRRRSPPPHSYAYQQPFSGSRDHFRRSPREPFPHTPTGHQGPPPPGYRYPGYAQPSPAAGYGRHPRSSPLAGYGYPGYPPPRQGYWMSPRADLDPYPEMDDQIPPPPSDDPNYPSQGTPEKLLSRSPFRSPPNSSQKFKRSPESSPHFGPSNSWGMDTPNATLANEFSPMETTLHELDDTTTFDLDLSRSNSHDSPGGLIHRAKGGDQSPMNTLMHGFSPYEGTLRGIAQSPMVQGRNEPPGLEQSNPVTASGARGDGSNIRGSTPSSVRKALWRPESPHSSSRGSRLRLEIGGAGSLSTSKALEGINTRLQSRPTASNQDSFARGQAMPHPGPRPFHGDIATPIKSSGYPRHTPMLHSYPGSANKYPSVPPPPSSSSKPLYGPPATPSTGSGGKENNGSLTKAPSSKRIPCNCKKTGCLKLYCICYAAREFCKDCNCTDCFNNEKNKKMVDEAVRQTQAKNRDAFTDKFRSKTAQGSPQAVHSVGCRCKKSECLKKYCECFQAGILCADKCKCVGCLNKAGSQALIDKRKKIKDQRGFELAVRVADEVWKGTRGSGGVPPARNPNPAPAASSGSVDRRPPSKTTPPMGHMPPPHLMQAKHHPSHPPLPHHGGPPHGHPHHPPPPYHHPMYMRGPPPGYPHMGMATPAGYGHPPRHHMHGDSTPHAMYAPPPHHRHPYSAPRRPGLKRHAPMAAPQVTPIAGTPRTPGVRVQFDPASSKKKRKISPGQEEASVPFFGMKYPAQPKTTALAVFSFLSNDDLYNAGLVCKSWSQLAMDDELWKFD